MRKDVEYGVETDTGMVRMENQDCHAYYEPSPADEFRRKGRLAVVADGMGGHNGGTVASHTAVETILRVFSQSASSSLKRLLASSIDRANMVVREMALADPALRNMGTTCVAIALRGRVAEIAHIGDSRAYLIRRGAIRQITRDHTYLNDLIEIGLITPEAAKNHPDQHIITRCVGMGAALQIDFNRADVEPGDIFVLCSDGLYKYIEDDEVMRVVTSHEPQESAKALVDLANARGGDDNTTVLVLRVNSIPDDWDIDDDEGELTTAAIRIPQLSHAETPRAREAVGDFRVETPDDDTPRNPVQTPSDTRVVEVLDAAFGPAAAAARPGAPPPAAVRATPDVAAPRDSVSGGDRAAGTPRKRSWALWIWIIILLEIVLIAIFEFLR